jgi:UDP-3-O-acyl N-acetylglycosamine deacetylase
MASAAEFQHTLAKAAPLSGTSLHTGAKVSLKIQPAAANSGIKFKRKDLMRDAELNRIAIKGLKDYSSLGETEKAQFIEAFMAFISFSQNAFYQWREKALSPPLWVGWESLTMNLLCSPGGKEFWKERGYVFGNEYRNYVEKVIMTKKPHPEARPLGAFKIG